MGADSKLFMKNGINVLALANYIKSVYGKSEVVEANLGIPGCYSLFFDDRDGEPRRMWFYTYESQEDNENPVPVINGKSVSLSLGYFGNAIEILTDIAKNFGGGYIQENDCGSEDDTDEWYYVEGENDNFVTRRKFKEGDVVHIEGDIKFDDYNVRVNTMAVVVDEPKAGDTQLMYCLDEIEGDHYVNVFVNIKDLLRYNPQYKD